jgi:hypothetical protein
MTPTAERLLTALPWRLLRFLRTNILSVNIAAWNSGCRIKSRLLHITGFQHSPMTIFLALRFRFQLFVLTENVYSVFSVPLWFRL